MNTHLRLMSNNYMLTMYAIRSPRVKERKTKCECIIASCTALLCNRWVLHAGGRERIYKATKTENTTALALSLSRSLSAIAAAESDSGKGVAVDVVLRERKKTRRDGGREGG